MDLQKKAFLSEDELLCLLIKIRASYKKPCDYLFTEANKLWKHYSKQGVITLDEEELHIKDTIVCNVPSCNQVFDSVFTYQTHYNALHLYICSQCKKGLPSPHLLDLHLSEQHDSFFALQAERQPMYSCFLDECKHKSSNPEERRDHCISIHKFPHNFRFDKPVITKKGLNVPLSNKRAESLKECSSSDPEKKESSNAFQNFTFGLKQTKMFTQKVAARSQNRGIHDEKMETQQIAASIPQYRGNLDEKMETQQVAASTQQNRVEEQKVSTRTRQNREIHDENMEISPLEKNIVLDLIESLPG